MNRFLVALVALLAPGLALAQDLSGTAQRAVESLEKMSGLPIVFLERTGDDPGQFWYRAMQKLCKKTGDNWCDDDLTSLRDTTNPIGWSRVLTYRTPQGTEKKVCVILPPNPGVSAGYVATGLSGGNIYSWQELPTSAEVETFITLMHGANCLNTSEDQQQAKRADAFAAMTLALIQGDGAFVSARDVTPARKFALYRFGESTRWAVNVAERILLDQWKDEAVAALSARNRCDAKAVASQNLATDSLQRDISLPQGEDCVATMGGASKGTVTDGNLWLWTTGQPGSNAPVLGLPPAPYTAFKGFQSFDAAIIYAFKTAETIASQR